MVLEKSVKIIYYNGNHKIKGKWKVTNQESIDYLNGIKIESEIEWLAEHHKYSSFKYNVTKGLQAKFVALHPYRHHWPKVCALKISRKLPLNFFLVQKKKRFL